MQRPKFQVQKKVMDFSQKVQRVIVETSCRYHNAIPGEPCYIAPRGVCGKRARQIFTDTPSDRSSMNIREYKRTLFNKEKTA